MILQSERGIAILTTLMAMLLMSLLAAALTLSVSTETMIAGTFRDLQAGAFAAESALERALADLQSEEDFGPVLTGVVRSTFLNGEAPEHLVNLANCAKATPCTDAEINRATFERPWGVDNPRWRLYAYGKLDDLLPEQFVKPRYSVAVLVAGANAGPNVISLRAEAFGVRGVHSRLDATVERVAESSVLRVISWRAGR
jgi:hypothetical protein